MQTVHSASVNPRRLGVQADGGGKRATTISCAECGSLAVYPNYACGSCGGPLVVDAESIEVADLQPDSAARGIWRHRAILPRTEHAVSLGEGSTPLVELQAQVVSGEFEGQLVAKLESQNPTLSFKDRAMALASSIACDLRLEGLVLASTGNAAVSAAAYAAAAGLRCRIVCGTGSRAGQKLAIAAAHGAEISEIDGDYSDAHQAATRLEGSSWLNVTTTYRNPMLSEAYRGLAIELVEQLETAPAAVIVPVGAGPLLYGLRNGFKDLQALGAIGTEPRLIGVQASACAPLARAWKEGDWRRSLAQPIAPGKSRAGAIADPLRGYEREGLLTLNAAKASGGSIVGVSEVEIQQAVDDLARCGLHVEPAAAASLAALRHQSVNELLRSTWQDEPSRSVVLLVTGHGAKEPVHAHV